MNVVKSKTLEIILNHFPQKHLSFAFAYGSGVYSQNSGSLQGKMIDFIFAVNDSVSFHEQNLKQNYHHYSMLKLTPLNFIKNIQEDFGAKIYYNTLITVDNKLIKYGVISTNDLIEDLLDWRTLYVSGRLQKPVKIIKHAETPELSRALVTNIQSALHASLLCLPESFTEEQLFLKIVGLSYNGDFRMYFGEDKKKMQNIVQNQIPLFKKLYESQLKTMPLLHWKENQAVIEQNCSCEATLHHLNLLPKSVQHNILVKFNRDGRYRDMEDVLQALAYDTECSNIVSHAIRDIVWWPSITQSVKGVFTAGVVKSIKYSTSKLKKMFKTFP